MRGKRYEKGHDCGCYGITPADAGKTGMAAFANFWQKDHPRGCGENIIINIIIDATLGSPPRMRGKRLDTNRGRYFVRITPADAGKTAFQLLPLSPPEDHPRGCGENVIHPFEFNPRSGSPPRMRGKRYSLQSGRKRVRITPADAGKTVPIRKKAAYM